MQFFMYKFLLTVLMADDAQLLNTTMNASTQNCHAIALLDGQHFIRSELPTVKATRATCETRAWHWS